MRGFDRRGSEVVRRGGFSLIELILVMGIIVILTGLGIGVFSGMKGSVLGNSISTAKGVFSSARSLAMARDSEVRVLLHLATSEPENYGRKLVVVYKDTDGAGGAVWRQDGDASFLSKGVLLDAVACAGFGPGYSTVQMDLVSGQEGTGLVWVVYPYNRQGVCLMAGARLIFGEGFLM